MIVQYEVVRLVILEVIEWYK